VQIIDASSTQASGEISHPHIDWACSYFADKSWKDSDSGNKLPFHHNVFVLLCLLALPVPLLTLDSKI